MTQAFPKVDLRMNSKTKVLGIFIMAFALMIAGCTGGSAPISLALSLASAAIDNGQTLNITVTVMHDKNGKGVTWALASGPGTLSGQTATSVTYNAPASGSSGTAAVTATSVADSTKSVTLNIVVTAVPSITTSSLPAGTEGTAYTQTVAAAGGAGTLTFSVSVGTLPAGLTMDSSGHITGTPTGPNGTISFTVKVADASTAGPQSATQALSIAVNLPAPPSITTTSLPAATEGTAYSQTVAATGGLTPYTFAISSGALPAGLSLNGGTGAITGTPTGPNTTSNFTVKVTDKSNPPQSATQNLSITVNLPPPPSISTSSLPAGTEGAAYNQTVAATGGLAPYTFAVTTGTLPAGLSMDTSGHITGTPAGPNGTASFTVTVTDSSNPPQTGSKGLSITINLPPAPTIGPTTLPNGNVGSPYSQTLTVSGGLGPFTWIVSSGTLPAGLVLTTNAPTTTAKVSGTPTTQQSNVAFTIQVTDTSNPPQVGQQAYTVTINPPAPLSITTTSPLPNGAFNTAYNTTIHATGGIAPYTFSLDATSSALPAGLNFSNDAVNNQGVISGTPTTAGMFTGIVVRVTDSQTPTAATTTATFALTITASAIVISPATGALPNGTVSTAYSTNISATGGVTPYTFSLDPTSAALPAGLSFTSNTTTGTISGTPTAAGTTNNIIVDVKDSEQPPVTQKVTYSLTINASSNCGSGSESLLNGGYAFLLKGFDSSGNPALVGGVLTFNGSGSITAGTIDMNLNSGVQTGINVSAGTFSVGSDHRGCMSLTTNSATNPTQNYHFSLGNISGGAASTGHVISFDTTSPFVAGIMRMQSGGPFSNSSVNGSFAFGGSSIQNSIQCPGGVGTCKFAFVGVITFNGSGGITSGSEDINQNGTLDINQTSWPASPNITFNGANSSYTIAANGRGALTIAINGAANTSHSVLYGVSSTEALFMGSDSQTTTQIGAGQALKQSGGPFSGSSLSGTYAGYSSALSGGAGGTTAEDLDLVTVANPNITGNTIENRAGTIGAGSISATYTISSAGRMVTTGGNHPALLVVVNSNEAFLLGSNGRVDFGFFQSQTATSPTSGAFAFGTIDPNGLVTDEAGVADFTSGNVSVTEDKNSSGTLSSNQTQSLTVSFDSTGVGHIPSGCTLTPTVTCQTVLLVISPTKVVVLDTTSTTPAVQVADQ